MDRIKSIGQMLLDGSYINLEKLTLSQLETSHRALKDKNKDLKICHALDRGFDDQNYFTFIDSDLKDDFVIRLKLNRNSNAIDIKSKKPIKLKDLDFPNKHKEIIPKTRIKNRIYSQLKLYLCFLFSTNNSKIAS